jgi:uncharacterized membrane protein YgaE (UPF0421/DUF939 family)
VSRVKNDFFEFLCIFLCSWVGATAGVLLYALLALFPDWIPARLQRLSARLVGPLIGWLRALQCGHIGDYVTWLTVGIAILGIACAFTLR